MINIMSELNLLNVYDLQKLMLNLSNPKVSINERLLMWPVQESKAAAKHPQGSSVWISFLPRV